MAGDHTDAAPEAEVTVEEEQGSSSTEYQSANELPEAQSGGLDDTLEGEIEELPEDAPEPTTVPETEDAPEPTTVQETENVPEHTTVPETEDDPETGTTPEPKNTPEPSTSGVELPEPQGLAEESEGESEEGTITPPTFRAPEAEETPTASAVPPLNKAEEFERLHWAGIVRFRERQREEEAGGQFQRLPSRTSTLAGPTRANSA